MARRKEKRIDLNLSYENLAWITQSLKKEYNYYANTYGLDNDYTNKIHKVFIKLSNIRTEYEQKAERQRIKENRTIKIERNL